MKKIILSLILICFYSCTQPPKYVCEKELQGWIVEGKDYKSNCWVFTISNNCVFKDVDVTTRLNRKYEVADTIGKTSEMEKMLKDYARAGANYKRLTTERDSLINAYLAE